MIFEKIKKSNPPKITNKIKIKCIIKVRFANNSYIQYINWYLRHLATERPLVILDFIITTTLLRRNNPSGRSWDGIRKEKVVINFEKGEKRKIPL